MTTTAGASIGRTGEGSAERIAVEACVRDYFEAWFTGDAERMRRALHPELAKRGWHAGGGDVPTLDRETSDSMVGFTSLGIGTRNPVENRRLDVEAVEVDGDIASVTVRSPIYREFLHLVRTADGWRILHSLWRPA